MNEDKFKKTRVERPDKAAFSAFLGTFLLIAGICFGVWAYWTFQHYRSAANYVEYLRQNPNYLLNTSYKQDDLIREIQNDADHDRLEAAWVGAVSLILLGGATWLFIRASKIYRRMKRTEYEEIDWRALEKPTHRLEVYLTSYQNRLSTGLIIFFSLMVVLNLIQLFRSSFTTTNDLIIKGVLFSGAIISLIGVFMFLRIRAKRRSVDFFDASGVTRGDGKYFLWSDFRGVLKRIGVNRFGSKYNWRTDLLFADGDEAWIIPQRIKNFEEIYRFVESLPPAVLKGSVKEKNN